MLAFLNLALVNEARAKAKPSTDLATVNKTTVKFASWAVRVTHGHAYNYKCLSKKNGERVTNHTFECCLVGSTETDYELAVVKGSDKEVTTARDKYWEVSNVKFEENAMPAFISSALKVSVDLAKSTLKRSEDVQI